MVSWTRTRERSWKRVNRRMWRTRMLCLPVSTAHASYRQISFLAMSQSSARQQLRLSLQNVRGLSTALFGPKLCTISARSPRECGALDESASETHTTRLAWLELGCRSTTIVERLCIAFGVSYAVRANKNTKLSKLFAQAHAERALEWQLLEETFGLPNGLGSEAVTAKELSPFDSHVVLRRQSTGVDHVPTCCVR